MTQLSLFDETKLKIPEAIELTRNAIAAYAGNYQKFAIAFSGGKDSTALVTIVAHLIESGQLDIKPEQITILYADTRQEMPPLQVGAMALLEEMRSRGFKTKVVCAELDKRFLVYILGRGVPPPNNSTMRWCTAKIKVEPMTFALQAVAEGEQTLMLTGVRLGESAMRDQRISTSCSKNGGECGQGWFQNMTASGIDTLAPILHWRVCNVWDWLFFEAPALGFDTSLLAEAYGGDEANEINARTGCTGCPLTDKQTALENLIEMPQWRYLAPLLQLHGIYRELRSFKNRLQKDGSETRKDGSLVHNPMRKGPLTLECRLETLDRILAIQAQINHEAIALNRPTVDIINAEEEARIRELIALKTFPQKWTGDEENGAVMLPETLPSGDLQLLLFGDRFTP